VLNPRREFLSNVWHCLVEVVALLQTAHVLGEPLNRMRLIIADTRRGEAEAAREMPTNPSLVPQPQPWSCPCPYPCPYPSPRQANEGPTLLQLGGTQVHGLPQAWKARPQLLELFERVMRSERPLVPWRNPASGGGSGGGGGGGGACFARLVLPLRSCQGAVLCRTWDRNDVCAPGGNPLAVAAAHAVLHAFGAEADARHAKAAPLVTLLTREDTARRGKGRGGRHRVLRNSAALVAAIARACPPVRVETTGLASLSFAAQLALMRRTTVPLWRRSNRDACASPPPKSNTTPRRNGLSQSCPDPRPRSYHPTPTPTPTPTLSRCLWGHTAQGSRTFCTCRAARPSSS
jgi:hypothetical protein